MAFLTAQKKETIARTKLSMEEEINEEKLAEVLETNMTETTEAIKELFRNRTKQRYFQSPVSGLMVRSDEPELEKKDIPKMLRYCVNLQKYLKNSTRVGNHKESVDASNVLNPEVHVRALMQNVIDNLQIKLGMEQGTEVNDDVTEAMNTIKLFKLFMELTDDQLTSDPVKEKLYSMRAWKIVEKLNADMQRHE